MCIPGPKLSACPSLHKPFITAHHAASDPLVRGQRIVGFTNHLLFWPVYQGLCGVRRGRGGGEGGGGRGEGGIISKAWGKWLREDVHVMAVLTGLKGTILLAKGHHWNSRLGNRR